MVPLAQQSFVLSLPGGAKNLQIETDESLRASGAALEMTVVDLRPDDRRYAIAARRYNEVEVFFLDDQAVSADGGFQLPPNATTDVVLGMAARPAALLRLLNGAAPNVVTVEAGAFRKVQAFTPGDARDMVLPPPDAEGVLRVRIESKADVSVSIR